MPPSWLLPLALAAVVALAAAVLWSTLSFRKAAAELAALRQHFAGFMDNGPFLAFMKDGDGRYVYENRCLVEHVGRIRPGTSSCLGRTDRELFPPAEGQVYVDNDHRVIACGKPLRFEEISVDAQGVVRHWSTIKFPRTDRHHRACVAGVSLDVTETRRAWEDAQSHEDRCRLALEAGRMGTLTLDLATQMLETSPLFAELHGRPETQTRLSLEESLAEVHPDDRQAVIDAVQAARRDRAPSRIQYRVVRPEGDVAWIELMGRVFCDEAGRPAIVRGVGFDVTERQESYAELNSRKAMLRRLIEVQENERQMLCHELHDGMMQYAIGAKMLLEACRVDLASTAAIERIDAALDCLNRGIAEGRQVIRGVRSAVLDDLGLVAAIQDLCDQMSSVGIAVEMTADSRLDDLPPPVQTTIYRVAQESLTNVRKHARTDKAVIRMWRTPIEVYLRVSDQGIGFDVETSRRHGFGLAGMKERMRLVGGTCSIESLPGSGSRIEAVLPIPGAAGHGRSATDEQFFPAATALVDP